MRGGIRDRGTCTLALALTLAACGPEGEAPLSADEREEVARLYADSVRALTDPTDSACRARRPRLTQALADSLYELRLADIERQETVIE